MMETKRLDNIPGLPEGEWAIIGKFTYGQSVRIKSNSLNVRVRTEDRGGMEGEVDLLEAQFLMLVYGVKEASFFKPEWTEAEKLKFIQEELPGDVGDFLFNEINMFNAPRTEVLKK